MKSDPWPFPADTPLDRARRIAQSYRHALESVDPELCHDLDERAIKVGQGWIRPLEMPVTDLDAVLTAEQLAAMFYLKPRTIRMWGYRGQVPVYGKKGKPEYRLGDVIDHLAKTRRERTA